MVMLFLMRTAETPKLSSSSDSLVNTIMFFFDIRWAEHQSCGLWTRGLETYSFIVRIFAILNLDSSTSRLIHASFNQRKGHQCMVVERISSSCFFPLSLSRLKFVIVQKGRMNRYH
jgi:hypothetical protein